MGRPAVRPLKQLSPAMAVERFLLETTEVHGEIGHVETSEDLHAAFLKWCSKRRVKPISGSAFGRELAKNEDFEATGETWPRQRAWKNIRLRQCWKTVAIEAVQKRKEAASAKPLLINGRFKPLPPEALVRRFLVSMTVRDGVSVLSFSCLYELHRKWCGWCAYWPVSPVIFAKMLTKLGIEPVRIGKVRQRMRRGCRLMTVEEHNARRENPYWRPQV